MQEIGLRKNLMGDWDFGGDEMLADDTVKEQGVAAEREISRGTWPFVGVRELQRRSGGVFVIRIGGLCTLGSCGINAIRRIFQREINAIKIASGELFDRLSALRIISILAQDAIKKLK